MTDAEITMFLCDELALPEYEWDGIDGGRKYIDFLSWDGFGLLLMALVTAGWRPEISYETDSQKSWTVYLHADNDPDMYTFESIDPDLKRALMLAAARAYGMEGV